MGTRSALISVLLGGVATAWGQAAQEAARPAPTATNPGPGLKPPPPATTQPVRDPRLEVTPTEFEFGDVWQGTPCKREFTLKNASAEPLKLMADSSCGCTVPTQPKSPLGPGESGTFTVTYDTKRVGPAHKKVTLRLADIRHALWEIPVDGEVKPIYAATPSNAIVFDGLETDSVAAKTIKLENKYDKPVPLKLAPPAQNQTRFDIQLKEIQPGMEYELLATTKPPLDKGFNRGTATLATGLPWLETLEYQVSANVQPRVIATPMRLFVPSDSTVPVQQTVRVQYRTDKPIKVLDVRTDQGPVAWELLPAPPAGAGLAAHQVRVTLPDADHLPTRGAQLTITTDDPSPEFAKLTIPILRGGPATSAPTQSSTQPQAVPIQRPPGAAPVPAEQKPATRPSAPGP